MAKTLRERLKEALKDPDFKEDYHIYRGVWKRRRVSQKQMKKNVLSLLVRYEKFKQTGVGRGYRNPISSLRKTLRQQKQIPFNEDFAYLVGAYLGNLKLVQGSRFSVYVKEEDVAEKMFAKLRKLTGKNGSIKKRKGLYQIIFSDLNLIMALEQATMRQKSVPIHSFKSFELKRAFLEGLFNSSGSGSMHHGNNFQISCGVGNRRIAEQTLLVLSELGIYPFIERRNAKEFFLHINQIVDVAQLHKLNILAKENKKKVTQMLKRKKTTRKSHQPPEFELGIGLKMKELGTNQEIVDKIERITGKKVNKGTIRNWPKLLPYAVQKLAEIYELSKKYNYRIASPHKTLHEFLEHYYPLSLSYAQHTKQRKTLKKKIKRRAKPK